MNKLSLYELSHEYLSALDVLTDPDSDIPMEAVLDTVEAMEYPMQEKAVNVAKFFRNLEASAKAIKEAEQQMAARRKALENRASALKDYLKTNMEDTGITKIESPWFKLSIQNNPPAVQITDAGLIPENYQEVIETVKVDKTAIKEKLKAGDEVPGAKLVQGTRLATR